MAQWQQGEVVENKHWSHRLCSLRIAVAMPEFEAGQFVRVGLPVQGADEMEARPYSFVNAPHENLLEIYFNRVPEGSLSQRLSLLEKGDKIWVADKAAGFMTMAEVPDGEDLWLLASGTALGPFLSILKTSLPWQRFKKVILVHGVRTQNELSYSDLISTWQQQHASQFMMFNSVTREAVEGALTDRIPESIENGKLELFADNRFDPIKSRVMICGNPDMVIDSMAALEAKGLKKHLRRQPGQLLQEVYQ